MKIELAVGMEDIHACFELLAELRPHLSLPEFCKAVRRMATAAGYRLAYLKDGEIQVVAGFRVSEWLHTGKYLEIEELVTRSGQRSKGYGGMMFEWIKGYAVQQGCRQVRLVSGIRRSDAHRFYERQGMVFEAKYFSLNI